MDTTNFEIFNRIALYLLVQLFEEFPGHGDIDANTLGLAAKPASEDETDQELWQNMFLASHTITWLEAEGFITIGDKTLESKFYQVRLTLKGLTLLGYAPPSAQDGKAYSNVVEHAKDVLADGTKGAAVEVVKSLFLGALTYFPRILA